MFKSELKNDGQQGIMAGKEDFSDKAVIVVKKSGAFHIGPVPALLMINLAV